MAIVRYDPWSVRPRSMLPQALNHFYDMFWPLENEGDELSVTGWRPRVDVFDQDGRAVIQAELPGVKKEDIDIDVRGNVLTLKGQRKTENEVDENDYYRKERFFGSFQRSFTLPEPVDPESVEANFSDGVLKVVVPKPTAAETKKIRIG